MAKPRAGEFRNDPGGKGWFAVPRAVDEFLSPSGRACVPVHFVFVGTRVFLLMGLLRWCLSTTHAPRAESAPSSPETVLP